LFAPNSNSSLICKSVFYFSLIIDGSSSKLESEQKLEFFLFFDFKGLIFFFSLLSLEYLLDPLHD